MRVYIQALILWLSACNGAAFSAIAHTTSTAKISDGSPQLEPVDKTLNGVGVPNGLDFDPTAGGSNAALTRNNKGEVWVSQVR